MSRGEPQPRQQAAADAALASLQRQIREKIRPRLRTLMHELQRVAESPELRQAADSVDAMAHAIQGLAAAIDDLEADAVRNAYDRTATSPAAAAPVEGSRRRLVRGGMDVRTTGQQVSCRVELVRDGETFAGDADEVDSPGGRARAAARATLLAAQKAMPQTRFALENVAVVNLAADQYIALAIEAAAARRFAHLAGIARLERSHEETACLAALNALERWTEPSAHRPVRPAGSR